MDEATKQDSTVVNTDLLAVKEINETEWKFYVKNLFRLLMVSRGFRQCLAAPKVPFSLHRLDDILVIPKAFLHANYIYELFNDPHACSRESLIICHKW